MKLTHLRNWRCEFSSLHLGGRRARRRLLVVLVSALSLFLVIAVACGEEGAEGGSSLDHPEPSIAASESSAGFSCSDWTYQQDAQLWLETFPSDSDGFDDDHDGIACEMLPRAPLDLGPGSDPYDYDSYSEFCNANPYDCYNPYHPDEYDNR